MVISNENIIMAIENLGITLSIWNDFNLYLIERITLIKTFTITKSATLDIGAEPTYSMHIHIMHMGTEIEHEYIFYHR
jgi:hypothetical protein